VNKAPTTHFAARDRDEGRRGVVLLAVLAAFTALALLAGVVATLSIADIRASAHFKRAIEAFYAADGGVQYVKSLIQADLAGGTLTLQNPIETVNYTAPANMSFDPVSRLVRTANTNVYYFSVTGREVTSKCTIEVTFRRASMFEMMLFGDEEVDLKAYGNVYSYDSSRISNPTPADSTGDALVAGNEVFFSHQDTLIDGSFMLGEDLSGNPGAWGETPTGGSIINGEAAVPSERINPDPLGADGGSLAADFLYYSDDANNDNSMASPPIVSPQNRILLKSQQCPTVVLSSGNYYVSSITLGNGTTLQIDSSSGPVNIYLMGPMEAKEGSSINFAGDPTDFSIFSISTGDIILKHSGSFKGVLYAPYADVQVRNSGDFYGICWGGSIALKNSGDVYLDLAARRKVPSNSIIIVSWKEAR